MKEFITKKHKHLLWQDELGDSFLILKYAEVFKFSSSRLRLYCWSFEKASLLRKKGWILRESRTDDPLLILDIGMANLGGLIELGAFKKRPNLKGKWLKSREKLLAHKILPYRPQLEAV